MTRRHALRQLLAHGPLTLAEIRDITGWPQQVVRRALYGLMGGGEVHSRSFGGRHFHYQLLGSNQ